MSGDVDDTSHDVLIDGAVLDQLPLPVCSSALDLLPREGFLSRQPSGSYRLTR